MQQSSAQRGPLRVTQEAIDAYERQTGFHGIGKIMVEHGVWVIVPRGEVAQAYRDNDTFTRAHAVGPATPYHDSNRADSAACIREGAP
jgi:hypothetical protein